MIAKEVTERLWAISTVLDAGDVNHAQSLIRRLVVDISNSVDRKMHHMIAAHIGDRLDAVAADLGYEIAGMLSGDGDA